MRPHEQALLFLRKAAEDEALLDEVLESVGVSDEIIGFHCQQAAEKLLKALLSELGVAFRRTHDLTELCDLLTDAGHPLPLKLTEVDALTPYAVIFRYADDAILIPLDRQSIRNLLRDLRLHVEGKITPSPRPSEQ